MPDAPALEGFTQEVFEHDCGIDSGNSILVKRISSMISRFSPTSFDFSGMPVA